MKHLEELADTFGFTIVIEKNSTRFGSSAKKESWIIPTQETTRGLQLEIRPKIETAYHELDNGLSIIAGTLIGDLGFLAYNSQHGGKECVELALLDKSKLGIIINKYFEINAHMAISVLAADFDSGLICLTRRMAGEKTYALIDDRRALKGKIDDPFLDGGGTALDQGDLGQSLDELPPEHSAP